MLPLLVALLVVGTGVLGNYYTIVVREIFFLIFGKRYGHFSVYHINH